MTAARFKERVEAGARTFVDAGRCFVEDGGIDLAAGLAFYTVFSLAPLLVVLVRGLSLVLGPSEVESVLVEQVGGLVGTAGTEQVRQVVEALRDASHDGLVPMLVSLGVALFGATTVLTQLQTALNRVWNVEREGTLVGTFLWKRLLSLGALGVFAVVLVLSVLTTAAREGLSRLALEVVPDWLEGPVAEVLDTGSSWLLFTVAFAVLFKFLPDARIRWRHVGLGAMATSALFVAGKQAIGLYLGASAFGSLYGAAGSLAAVLTWVFYSAVLILYGAELTRVWAHRLGRPVRPVEGARWIDPPVWVTPEEEDADRAARAG